MASAAVRSLIERRELIRRCDRAGITEIVSIARLIEAHVLKYESAHPSESTHSKLVAYDCSHEAVRKSVRYNLDQNREVRRREHRKQKITPLPTAVAPI